MPRIAAATTSMTVRVCVSVCLPVHNRQRSHINVGPRTCIINAYQTVVSAVEQLLPHWRLHLLLLTLFTIHGRLGCVKPPHVHQSDNHRVTMWLQCD